MKIASLVFGFVFVFLFFFDINAQVQVVPTAGEFLRGPVDTQGGATGTFHFSAPNIDINGSVVNTLGGGVYTACEFGFGGPCGPGKTLMILENITGQTAIRQNISPVMINGTTYETIVYNGSNMRFEAGTVRLPWTIAKRDTLKVTYTGRLTGVLNGRPNPAAAPIFQVTLNLQGTVTLTLKRNNNAPLTYSLLSVAYNFPGS